jgi:hypothetical protein
MLLGVICSRPIRSANITVAIPGEHLPEQAHGADGAGATP